MPPAMIKTTDDAPAPPTTRQPGCGLAAPGEGGVPVPVGLVCVAVRLVIVWAVTCGVVIGSFRIWVSELCVIRQELRVRSL